MKRFPLDCTIECPHYKTADMSVDDRTSYCDLLKVRIDDCDGWDIRYRCPLEEGFTREYRFDDPFMPPIMCRPNCCLFCKECTDIYYDGHGPYGIVCLKGGDFKDGMLGKCPYQKEQEEESK